MMEYWLFIRILSITIFIVKTNSAIKSFLQNPLQRIQKPLGHSPRCNRVELEANTHHSSFPAFQHSKWGAALTCYRVSVILVNVGFSNTTRKLGDVIFHEKFLKIQ